MSQCARFVFEVGEVQSQSGYCTMSVKPVFELVEPLVAVTTTL
jgi:hypothetical protein